MLRPLPPRSGRGPGAAGPVPAAGRPGHARRGACGRHHLLRDRPADRRLAGRIRRPPRAGAARGPRLELVRRPPRADLLAPAGGALARWTAGHRGRRRPHLAGPDRAGRGARQGGRLQPRRVGRGAGAGHGGRPLPPSVCAGARRLDAPAAARAPRRTGTTRGLRTVDLRALGPRRARRAARQPRLLRRPAARAAAAAGGPARLPDALRGARSGPDRRRAAAPRHLARGEGPAGLPRPLRRARVPPALLLLHRVADGRQQPVVRRPTRSARDDAGDRPGGLPREGRARFRAARGDIDPPRPLVLRRLAASASVRSAGGRGAARRGRVSRRRWRRRARARRGPVLLPADDLAIVEGERADRGLRAGSAAARRRRGRTRAPGVGRLPGAAARRSIRGGDARAQPRPRPRPLRPVALLAGHRRRQLLRAEGPRGRPLDRSGARDLRPRRAGAALSPAAGPAPRAAARHLLLLPRFAPGREPRTGGAREPRRSVSWPSGPAPSPGTARRRPPRPRAPGERARAPYPSSPRRRSPSSSPRS